MRWLLGLLLLATAASSAHAIEPVGPLIDQGNGKIVSGTERYITSYSGVVCNGSTSDTTGFNTAYDDLKTLGGTIVIPAGVTCAIGTDVQVESNVKLRCEPGGTLAATGSPGTYTFGMFDWFTSAATDSPVEGCEFDLMGKAVAALAVFFARNPVTNSRFYGGATSNGSNWNMVATSCAGGGCAFSNNSITCASTSGAKDTGVNVAGSGSAGQATLVENNQVVGCDINGINNASGNVNLVGNNVSVVSANTTATGISTFGSVTGGVVTAAGSSSVGISSTGTVTGTTVTASGTSATGISVGANGAANGNKVTASGATSIGIALTGLSAEAVANRIDVSGKDGIAIKTSGGRNAVVGNTWALTSNDASTDSAIGVYMNAGSSQLGVISGNIGTVSTTDSQAHIVVGGQQVVVSGNQLTSGKYCIMPNITSGSEGVLAINTTVIGNRCYTYGVTAVVATTGWLLNGNYLAWGAQDSTGIEIGYNTGTYAQGTMHTTITGNLIHSVQSGYRAIKVNDIGNRCGAGTRSGLTCSTDDDTGTGCPPSCASSPGGDCCFLNEQSGVSITGNLIMTGVNTQIAAIDFSTGVSSTSGDTRYWVIDGNWFVSATTAGAMMIKCPSTNQQKVYRIQVGSNVYSGYTAVTGDTTRGMYDANCTPDMIDGTDWQYIWLPAAGCNNTTAYPMMDLGTTATTRPAAACKFGGSNADYWGVLDFPDGADEKFAFVNVNVPGLRIYSAFVRPIYTTSGANSLVTRWGFSGRNITGDSGIPDTAFGSEVTLDSTYGGTADRYETPTSYATMGNIIVGSNGMFSIKVRRVSNSGSDTQTSTASLLGVQLFLRRMD